MTFLSNMVCLEIDKTNRDRRNIKEDVLDGALKYEGLVSVK